MKIRFEGGERVVTVPGNLRQTVADALRFYSERLREDAKGFYGTAGHAHIARETEQRVKALDEFADAVGD